MSRKVAFDDICRYLKDNGFIRHSVQGSNKQIWMNDDRSLSITIEENIETLTEEEEEIVKERLRSLGYLD